MQIRSCSVVTHMLRLNSTHLVPALSLSFAFLSLGLSVGCMGKHANHGASPAPTQVDFNRDVQPILASNCFSCHGPDPGMRKAGLRLDLGEAAFKKRPGKPEAIVPGRPEASELIRRIESTDPHYLMPQSPQGEAKPMKPAEIAILKQWVAEGAHYKPHWAFDPPVRASLPEVQEKGWAKSPIDLFVLARLEKEGLHPSPEADKATLIRRVTLDLTGLLPSPREVEAFIGDSSPEAYEHLVDRLLASPRFGEARARYWLDYARYADTCGLSTDSYRAIWPYRDYLIKAFNSNMPFDEFAKEQIAGDLLPAKTIDQIVATGYVRAGVSTNEGGTIPEELRFNLARERAEAYGATFLGLTVGCAVCHDHKYDPTTQKDFYQLSAFFNNVNEEPYNGDRPDWLPVIRIPKPQNTQAYNQALARRASLLNQLNASRMQERNLIQQWLTSKQNSPLQVSTDKLQLRLRLDEGVGSVVKNSAPEANPKSFSTSQTVPQWGETTWLWPDFRMDTSTQLKLGQLGDFEGNQAFSGGGWFMARNLANTDKTKKPLTKGLIVAKLPAAVMSKKDPNFDTGVLISKSDSTQQDRGWELWFAQGKISVDLINEWPKKAIRVTSTTPFMVKGRWYHIFFTYDGSQKAAGVKLYVNGQVIATKVDSDALTGPIRTSAPLQLGWRYPDANPLRATRYQDIRLYARALTAQEAERLPYEDYVAEITAKPSSRWNRGEWHTVSDFYFNNIDATSRGIQAQIKRIDSQLDELGAGGTISEVAEEKPTVAYANVLARGVYSARLDRVEADTPHFLPALPAGQPHNRRGLAEWTVSAKNPLTARVAVNRMWNEVFGTGLVETTEDFGIVGGRPSHPELLDWLAVEFRESGWNIKHMYKLMVMSAAYRQSSRAKSEEIARDPRNLLLARGPRFRMDGEILRDIALESSGLLVEKIGGPSVKPYQPGNVWEAVSDPESDTLYYKQDHGDDLYRRSLYTFWKRVAFPPDMDAFDGPPRDSACTRRQRTNTPLQALVTLNDPQWVEAARVLAERLVKESGPEPAQRIRYLSEILLAHDPSPVMQQVLQSSFEQSRRHYAQYPNAAHDLIAVGEKPHDTAVPAPELAAWTIVASQALNLDETLNK